MQGMGRGGEGRKGWWSRLVQSYPAVMQAQKEEPPEVGMASQFMWPNG